MPLSRIAWLLGTQYQKAALRVVPPTSGAFSRISTLLPSQREKSAVARPPAPAPTQTMSKAPS